MYASYYNLKKEAFNITPDPEFLFLSPSHKEALGSIIYGVQHRKGFVSITGEVGVGKTTILRSYLEQVDRRKLKIIYIFNSNVSFLGLLKTICQELDKTPCSDSDFELVNQLHEVLIEVYKKGFNVVLIIDEAQNMPVKTLENLRMLSNLETSTDKLIQIVFSGQPEFERMLGMEELRQLRQRVAVKATILPLTAEESLAYIHHRLAKVSAGNSSIFTDGALKKIVMEGRGIPRVINIICENAFITALGYQKKQINSQIVREVIADFAGGEKKRGFRAIVVFLSIILVLICFLLVYLYKDAVVATPVKRQSAALSVQNDAGAVNVSDNSIKQPLESAGDDISDSPGKKAESAANEEFPVVVTVRKGDTLSSLVWRIYGFSSKELIMLVKNRNNSIYDADIISVGQQIVFPAREKRSGKTHE
jgi:general secretion pathway protein A